MIWTYIKAEKFFPKYCPMIRSYKHKIRGLNGRGNPVGFSKEEKTLIMTGLRQMVKDGKEKYLK